MPSGVYIRRNGRPFIKLVCRGCGKDFESRRYHQQYCTQSCYLTNDNPRKNPLVIEKIRAKLRDPLINPSKRPEVRALISMKLKGRDAPWTKGENNVSKRPDVREKIKQSLLYRWRNTEFAERMLISCRDGGIFGVSVEGPEHARLKVMVLRYLGLKGYMAELEKPVRIAHKWYIVDVVGQRNNTNIAVECGDCKTKKLNALETYFNKVLHLPYEVKNKEAILCKANI